MAKSTKKNSKKVVKETAAPVSVNALNAVAIAVNKLQNDVPVDLQERFSPQIGRVAERLIKIAGNLEKACQLEATKDERETKKAERVAARRAKLEAQLKATQEKLAKLDS